MKTILCVVGVIAAIVLAMYLWTVAGNLVSAKSDEAMILGFLLYGVLIGLVVFSIVILVKRVKKSLKAKGINQNIVPILLIILMLGFASACTKVSPGYVGVKVYNYGHQKGVQDFPVRTGRVWFNPFTQDVYKFPTFLQTISWTKDRTEGSPNDDSITFNSVEGAVINADIAISYAIMAEKVPSLFVEFRQDAHTLTWGYVRSQVRDAFGRHGSRMRVVDIFGARKQELLTAVKSDLNEKLETRGFKFDMVSFIGGLRVDPKVESAINAVIEAMQRAVEAENKIKQSEAEAKQRIAAADGEAKAILAVAKAQAEANKLVAQSVSAQLINWEAIKKWNGILPQFTSGGIPLIQLPVPEKK